MTRLLKPRNPREVWKTTSREIKPKRQSASLPGQMPLFRGLDATKPLASEEDVDGDINETPSYGGY